MPAVGDDEQIVLLHFPQCPDDRFDDEFFGGKILFIERVGTKLVALLEQKGGAERFRKEEGVEALFQGDRIVYRAFEDQKIRSPVADADSKM